MNLAASSVVDYICIPSYTAEKIRKNHSPRNSNLFSRIFFLPARYLFQLLKASSLFIPPSARVYLLFLHDKLFYSHVTKSFSTVSLFNFTKGKRY